MEKKFKPIAVVLEESKNHAWCACGKTSNEPFCDGTHKSHGLKPLIFKPEKSGEHYLCTCKQSSNPPYCDGSHNK